MAGFFSLASATYDHHHHQHHNNNHTNSQQNPTPDPTSNPDPIEPTSWFLYSTTTNTNEHRRSTTTTTTTKDFELWQQPLHAHNLLAGAEASLSMGTGVTSGGDGRIINFSDESTWGSAAFMMMGRGGSGGVNGGSGGVNGGGVSCQDCGNQAKKDCSHFRCRTCCKSRGFQCQTHVKSTWVPAAKRRERQQFLAADQQDQNRRRLLHHSNTKRTRSIADNPANPNLPNPISAIAYNSSGLLVGGFPSEVTTPASFRCVRVSSIDETDDQLAYQVAVNIGGHLFKGILYDQGPEGRYIGGDTSSGGSAGTAAVENLIGHSLYASLGGNDYMTSTQIFHQISRN